MSAPERGGHPHGVPILTEVVLLPEPTLVDIPIEPPSQAIEVTASDPPAPAAPAAAQNDISEDQIVERVWADLQRQVDLMLEYRLRETLSPILSRATEAVLREARQQLASSLRDVVARAVAQELARHRDR